MAIDMERLLRLTADFHDFCNDGEADEFLEPDSDELSLEDLDFIAAAANIPILRDPFDKP